MSKFSEALKNLRTSHKLTQEELAKKLRISRSAIGMYESGDREPDFETLEAIADLFNTDMNTLHGHDMEVDYAYLVTLYRNANEQARDSAVLVLEQGQKNLLPGLEIVTKGRSAASGGSDLTTPVTREENRTSLEILRRLQEDKK